MKCSSCKKHKSRNSFNKNKAQSSGYQYYCKKCEYAAQKKWQTKHPEKARQKNLQAAHKFHGTIKGRASCLINAARARARHSGKCCTLTRAWIEQRLKRGACEVTGLPFVLLRNGHRTNSFSPSIDKINSNGGYTARNCRLVVWIFNRALNASPIEDLETMIQAYLKRNKI